MDERLSKARRNFKLAMGVTLGEMLEEEKYNPEFTSKPTCKVIRRCVTKEQAEEELCCLFGRLTEFDGLRAHFLLGCILAECKPTEPGAPLTHQEKDAILLRVRRRIGGVVDIADSWDAINAILAKRRTTHSTSARNAPIASATQPEDIEYIQAVKDLKSERDRYKARCKQLEAEK